MIKYLLLLFNTFALLIYQFFFADGITITQKAQGSAKVGSEFTVELVIKKGDADGFAKLQQELPDGFEATAGATDGASFTFSNNSVKFIWMAMPNDKEMKISYKIKVDGSIVPGDKFIAGKFAYVVNNVKQQVEISPVTINIEAKPAPVVSAPPVVTPPANTDKNSLVSVSGNYFDDKDAPISNLKVLLKNASGEVIQSTITDTTGFFLFSKLSIDKECMVALEETDTHMVGLKSKANYKDSKDIVVLTKDLKGNAPAAVATETVTPTEPPVTTTETPATNTVVPPAVATKVPEPAVAYQPPSAVTETPTTKAPETTNVTPTPPPAATTGPEASSVVCTRNVPESVSESSFNVEITINKGNIGGFAKYIETLPGGLVASAKESAGASFSFIDGKIKFVWVSLPTTPTFKISYKVDIVSGTSGMQPIDGSFSYIENDETKRSVVATSNVNILVAGSTPAVANANTPANTNEQPVVTPPTPVTESTAVTPPPAVTKIAEPLVNKETTEVTPPVVKTETPAEIKKAEPEVAAVKSAPEPKVPELSASTIPSPQGNVSYSVQIAALRNARTAESLASLYNIKQKVNTEMADGFTKYVVGSHKVYKEAHDARDQIKTKGVSDAWVTAYNQGKRITVQEALMITSQKWYK